MKRRRAFLSVRHAGLLLALVGVTQLLLQSLLLDRGPEYVVTAFPIDDAYYYLQSAWNAHQLGFVTFDGIHRANGVQFLWFVLVYLLAFLTTDKMILLYAMLVLSFVLNVSCYLVIWQIGQVLNRPLIALLMAAVWSVISFSLRFYSAGMENSLHAVIFWCVIWQTIVFLKRVQKGEKLNFISLTAVLVLNGWSRIDSGLVSAIVFFFCLATLYVESGGGQVFKRTYGRRVALAVSFAILGALVLPIAYYVMGGTFLPISSLVKSAPAAPGIGEFALLWLYTLGMTAGGLLPQPFGPFILLGMAFGVALLRAGRDTPGLVALRRIWYVLLGSWLLYHLFLLASGAVGVLEDNFWYYWYLAPWHIFLTISFGLLIDRLVAVIGGEEFRLFGMINPPRGDKLAPVAQSVAMVLTIAVLFLSYQHHFDRLRGEIEPNVYTIGYRVAQWLDTNVPDGAILASWNAGQLGYFSNRSVINLDGLMNDANYYETVLLGEKTLAAYLEEKGVDFVVDYEQANGIYRRLRPPETDGSIVLESVEAWSIPGDDDSVHVWRVIINERSSVGY